MAKDAKETVESRIAVEYSQDVPTYYVNHAEVALGMHECAIWCARLPARPTVDELQEIRETGEFVVEPEVQLLIPSTMVLGLIGALQTIQTMIDERNMKGTANARP